MKALKEKRISLRSLWRRGLVILSLFALVFASCSDSGGGLSGKVAKTVTLDTTNMPKQYMGAPIDLTGVTATVKYEDGSEEILDAVKNPDFFTVKPRAATGVYSMTIPSTFFPMTTVAITVMGTTFNRGVTVVDIVRAAGDSFFFFDLFLTDPGDISDPGVFSTGVDVVGDLKNPNMNRIRADFGADPTKDLFDFDGFTIQATYVDGQTRYINKEDVRWAIFPDYGGDAHPKKKMIDAENYYYPGWVYMMVGADNEGVMNTTTYPRTSYYYYGVTDRKPLERVYTVESFEIVAGDKLPDFFFWDANTPAAWAKKLADAKYAINVKYSDGGKDLKPISDLIVPERIWWDFNPAQEEKDFYVRPLSYPFNQKNNYDPFQGKLILYYRGIWGGGVWNGSKEPATIEIPVFTKYLDLDVVVKDEKFSLVGSSAVFNNDGYEGAVQIKDESDMAKQLTVTATYEAYNMPGTTTTKELGIALKGDGTYVGTTPLNAQDGLHYVTDFNTVANKIMSAKTVEDVPKNIKITYTVDSPDVMLKLSPLQKFSYVYQKAGESTNPTTYGAPLDKQLATKNPWKSWDGFNTPVDSVTGPADYSTVWGMDISKLATNRSKTASILWTYKKP